MKNVIRTITLAGAFAVFANCIAFGREKLDSIVITPPQRKFEKTAFVYTIKNLNAFGVDIGISKAENEAFEKTLKSEVDSCGCFKEYEVIYMKDYDKEKLPKGKSVIFYDVTYSITTSPGATTIMNFISMGTAGIIPSGYGLSISTEIKLFDKKLLEVKSQAFQNKVTMVGGTVIFFIALFRDTDPYILDKITNHFLAGIVNTNLIASAK